VAEARLTSAHGPWNPGVESEIPPGWLALSTLFRAENASRDFRTVQELHDLTGLALEELAVFRPERLVVHELLIRVTADLSVPDGPRVEDLGINFRRMVETILTRHLTPHLPAIIAEYERVKQAASQKIDAALEALFPAKTPAPTSSGVAVLLQAFRRARETASEDEWTRGHRVLQAWAHAAQASESALERAACAALGRVVSALRAKHGRIWADRALIARLALGIACNEQGSEAIGALVEPHIRRAAEAEGYALLPSQSRPVVMNTKGASASGKSTLRPLQRALAGALGIAWSDFALISPDIWRKYLLDYSALGDACKYAGAFTGRELAIVDHKLDRYMARKAERGGMSHLLIDRFRFDSFAPDSDEAGSNLLTRFGNRVYMFFMVTAPDETVERSWKRGLEVGRYKAVDDLLAHNVEAYNGMPQLFFTWALRENKDVHYEFLDNSVALGETPRSIAFGWNGELNVLDVKCMLDIDRYRKIDVNAKRPADVYPDHQAMAPENNTAFLAQCVRLLPVVNFADRDTGRIYARTESGALAWCDPECAEAALMKDAETRAGLAAVAPELLERLRTRDARAAPRLIAADRYRTLGRWGAKRA
jgi:hypothetical protein